MPSFFPLALESQFHIVILNEAKNLLLASAARQQILRFAQDDNSKNWMTTQTYVAHVWDTTSAGGRVAFFRIDAQIADCFLQHLRGDHFGAVLLLARLFSGLLAG
jgi:hypothetical protein